MLFVPWVYFLILARVTSAVTEGTTMVSKTVPSDKINVLKEEPVETVGKIIRYNQCHSKCQELESDKKESMNAIRIKDETCQCLQILAGVTHNNPNVEDVLIAILQLCQNNAFVLFPFYEKDRHAWSLVEMRRQTPTEPQRILIHHWHKHKRERLADLQSKIAPCFPNVPIDQRPYVF